MGRAGARGAMGLAVLVLATLVVGFAMWPPSATHVAPSLRAQEAAWCSLRVGEPISMALASMPMAPVATAAPSRHGATLTLPGGRDAVASSHVLKLGLMPGVGYVLWSGAFQFAAIYRQSRVAELLAYPGIAPFDRLGCSAGRPGML